MYASIDHLTVERDSNIVTIVKECLNVDLLIFDNTFYRSWNNEVVVVVVLRIYVASAVFQPYRNLEVGDNRSLKP